jgi:hypothetical protein
MTVTGNLPRGFCYEAPLPHRDSKARMLLGSPWLVQILPLEILGVLAFIVLFAVGHPAQPSGDLARQTAVEPSAMLSVVARRRPSVPGGGRKEDSP